MDIKTFNNRMLNIVLIKEGPNTDRSLYNTEKSIIIRVRLIIDDISSHDDEDEYQEVRGPYRRVGGYLQRMLRHQY